MSGPKPTIAPTIHHTKPTDKVPGVDVYSEKRQTPINNITKFLEEKTNKLFGGFLGNIPRQDLLKLGKKAIAIIRDPKGELDKFKKSGKDILKNVGVGFGARVLQQMGIVNNADQTFEQLLKADNKKAYLNVLMQNNSTLRAIVDNDSVKKLMAKDWKDLNDLSTIIYNLTGDSELIKIFDMEGTFALLNQTVKSARMFGMPELYDSVMEQIKLEDDKLAFALQQIPQSYSTNDYYWINRSLQLTNAGTIMSNYPDMLEGLVSGYVRKDKTGSPVTQASSLFDILNQFNSNWSVTSLNGAQVKNLELYRKASPDLIEAMLLMPEHRTCAAIVKSSKYSSDATALDLFRNQYPQSGLS